jgi:hypothetical protein
MRTRITHISFRALIPLLLFFTLVINAPELSAAPAGSTYPVQVTPMLIPPYSLYLSDYFSGTTERLSLTLTNRDLQQPQVRVKLRLTIACASGLTLTTHPQAIFDPIVLDAGVPTRLTMQELAPYFLPARLLTQGYMQGGKLTEGNVEFGFEVLEYNTGKVLSQKNIAFGNIISPKPPKLNLPINNDIVTVNEPQQLTFQWSPQYFSTGNVEYEFVIKELMDKTASPQEAFLYSREVYRTTATASAINYTMGEPTLEGNKRYAWCVRAVMHEGVETINRFENDGYSPVSVFDMRYDCRPPTDVQATTERGTIMLRWLPQPHHLKYVVSYRRTDFDANTWYTKTTTSTFINLSDIAPGQNYTYRVGAYCDDNTPVYSAPGTISVPAEDTEFLANCGKDPQIKITNRKPKGRLNVNDIIMAGDFPVTITSVSGGNGTFTGEGWVRIPYLFANFGVRFSGIGVSEENRLISGQVETKYDKTESGVSNLDALDQGGTDGNIKSGITKANKTVEFALPEKFTVQYSEELATLTFKDETGTAIGNVDIPKNPAGKPILPLTVEDKNGNVYEVHENPEKSTTNPQPYVAVKLGKQEGEIPFGSMDLNVQDEAKATVTFANDASSLYALDTWQNYYSSVGIISGGNGDPNSNFDGCKYEKIGANYWVKWKYIPPGKTDKVTAELLISDKAKIDPAKVVFKTKAGKVFESSYNATTHNFTITLLGGEDKDGQELYAMHPATESGKYWNLGKLDMMSYAPVERKMVLVKTTANDNTDATTVQTELNRIYNPVGISWSVSSEQFTYNTDNIFEGKSGVISTYLPNMRTLNAAFIAAKADKLETKTAYLFLVNQTAGGDRDKQGFMPRGMQFGYINTSTANVSSVIAHELGHGAFKLYHTFNSGYGSTAVGTQGTTENLMDYKGGINLAKWQWDQMYDPAIINGVFDGDKEAMLIHSVWLTPDWKPFKFDESSIVTSDNAIVQGTIAGIVFENKSYYYKSDSKGYYALGVTEPLKIVTELGTVNEVFVYQHNGGCGADKYYTTTWAYLNSHKNSIDFNDKTNVKFVKNVPCSGTSYFGDGGMTGCRNLTHEAIDLSDLEKLFNGKSTIQSDGRTLQSSKAILFLTGINTSSTEMEEVRKYEAKDGVNKIWLHKDANGNWIIKQCSATDALNKTLKEKGFALFDLSSIASISVPNLATVLYQISDLLSSGIGHAYIPKEWWNCTDKAFDQPLLIAVLTKILTPSLDVAVNFAKSNIPALAQALKEADAGKISFAALAGCWDGIVGMVDALPQATKMLTMTFADDPNAQKEFDVLSGAIENKGGGFPGFCSVMWTGISSQFDLSQPCLVAHTSGEFVFTIVAAIYTGGASSSSVVGKAVQSSVKFLNKLDVFGNAIGEATGYIVKGAFKGASKAISITANKGAKFIDCAIEKSATVFKVYNAGKTVAEAVNWSNIKNKVTLLIDGNKKEFKFASGEPIESGQYKITNFLRDENNVVLRSDDGGFVAVLENINKSSDKKTALLQGDVDWEKLSETGDAAGLENLTLQVTVAGKIIKLGDEYAGIAVQRLRAGTNGKIFIVARQMDPVTKVADEMTSIFGTENVEIFSQGATECRFLYQGKKYLNTDFASLLDDLKNSTQYDRYLSGEFEGQVKYEKVLETKLGKLNEAVIDEKIQQGYTIIDLGNPNNVTTPSGFYDMEMQHTFK